LEGVGPGVLAQPVVAVRRDEHEPRERRVLRLPIRYRHNDPQREPADCVEADDQGGPQFLNLGPTAGSKLTNQISPRLGVGTVDMKVAFPKRLESGQGRVAAVFVFSHGGGGLKDGVSLCWREAA
jgi:hypothetical protein